MGLSYHTAVGPMCFVVNPKLVHGGSMMVGPWCLHDSRVDPWWVLNSMVRPWFVHGDAAGLTSHGVVMVVLWLARGGPIVGRSWYHEAPRWVSGQSMVLSWGFHGECMGSFLHAALVARNTMANSVHRLF